MGIWVKRPLKQFAKSSSFHFYYPFGSPVRQPIGVLVECALMLKLVVNRSVEIINVVINARKSPNIHILTCIYTLQKKKHNLATNIIDLKTLVANCD